MTININGRATGRAAAIIAVVIATGAVAFFGGTSTRMSDSARASEQTSAVKIATADTREADRTKFTATLTDELRKASARQQRAVKRAKRNQRRITRANERKRADKKAAASYSAGSSAGYSSGHATGYSSGYSDGDVSGYVDGILDAGDY